jgi:hypothetical protein
VRTRAGFLLGSILAAAAIGGAVLLFRHGPVEEVPERPPSVPEGGFVVRVLDPRGGPAVGARLEVFATSPFRLDAAPVATVTADDGGWAAIPKRPGDPLSAVVSRGGSARTVFALEDGAELQLEPGAAVSGLVTDLLGRPLAGARVLSPPAAPHAAETVTGADGTFTLGPLAEDAWVRAEAGGHAPLELSLSLYPAEERDFVFHLSPEWRVAGRVVDSAGNGVSGAIVELDQESRSRVAASADGRFSMGGVLPSWEVLLTARAPGLIGPPVTALAGQTELEIPLYRPAEIRGRVLRAGTGEPIEEFDVPLLEAEILPGGRFRIGDLPPGETALLVRAGTLRGEVVVGLREGESRSDVAVTVAPPVWSPPGELRPASALVEMRAVDEETGGAAEGARVRLLPAGGEGRTDRNGEVAAWVPSGPTRLLFGGVLDGWEKREVRIGVPLEEDLTVGLRRNPTVKIELRGGAAIEEAKLSLEAPGERRRIHFTGDRVSFPATCGAEIDLLLRVKGFIHVERKEVRIPEDHWIPVFLQRGPVIRGRCLGEAGHPLPKAVAELEEDPTSLRMETLGDGRFRVGPVLPGSYRVVIYARNIRTREFDVDVREEDVDLEDVRLMAPCDLTVLVTTSDGAPVPGAQVETSYLVPAKGVTDEGGRILLPGRNRDEVLRVRAEGFLDGWKEVEIPDDRRRMEEVVRLLRPARILIRALDRNGRAAPVLLPDRDDLTLSPEGPGEILVTDLPPGPLELGLEDRDGRKGVLRTIVREGEVRVETVVLE